MGYKKGPVGYMKASTGNKAVGYMAEGSSAYMSALYQTDPKDGVVVTDIDESKSAEEARAEREAKRKQELTDAKEQRQIAKANKIEELKFNKEEKKAAAAAELQRRQQKLKKRQGRIPEDSEDTSTNYTQGPLNQNADPKDGGTTKKMKDLPFNTRARYEEYRNRNWKQDETSLGEVGGDNITDLTKWQKTGKSKDIQRRMPRK